MSDSVSRAVPQIKGMGIMNVVKLLRRHRDAASTVVPEHLHAYLERRVLPSSWYPETDYVTLLRAIGTLQSFDGETHRFAALGAEQARGDLQRVYSVMVRRGDPVATLERLSALWKLYHDTGEVTVALAGRASAAVILQGYEQAAIDVCAVNGGFLEQVLTLADAQDLRMQKTRCRAAGAQDCRWQLDWADRLR